MKKTTTALLGTLATAAFSHDGHGLMGAHGHASDAWGFVVLGLAVALLLAGRK